MVLCLKARHDVAEGLIVCSTTGKCLGFSATASVSALGAETFALTASFGARS